MAIQPRADVETDQPATPYAPSWLNRLIGWIERLPGPTWAAYLALVLASVLFSNAQAWASGQLPLGEFAPDMTYWGVFLIALIWVVGYLDGIAAASFDAFRPLLDLPEAELASLRYRLVVLPAGLAWACTIGAFVLTPLYYLIDPVGSKVVGLSPVGLVLRDLSESFSSAVLLLIILQLVRQARMVNAIVASAPHVDLFQPGPLYAFSKLTSRTSIALVVLIGTSSIVAAPPVLGPAALALWLPWLVGIPALAIAAFVLPFRGMHSRLVAEKERLQADAEARLRDHMRSVNAEVDAGDLSRADALNKTLATLLQQREVVGKLPTWPWSTSTLRAIVTAVALPLGLFLMQRLLSQIV